MAITRRTLQLLRTLRVDVGKEADQTVRSLTRAWVKAWDELGPAWRAALAELAAAQIAKGDHLSPWELQRLDRLRTGLVQSRDALVRLGEETGIKVRDSAGEVIHLTHDAEPRLIASQLPSVVQPQMLARFAGRVGPSALDAIVARVQGQITSTVRPLSSDAYAAMERALIRGVALGDNPVTVARDMLRRVRGEFDGGLTRATVISRTEILDAYRAMSGYEHAQNADVLGGWIWTATLDSRTCPSCWSMHGREFPLTQPGPFDHQQGRCARAARTKTWAELGFHGIKEPTSAVPDARATFNALPEDQQLAIMGPARLAALKSGATSWDDLATLRQNSGWRPSYVPTPVSKLPTAV